MLRSLAKGISEKDTFDNIFVQLATTIRPLFDNVFHCTSSKSNEWEGGGRRWRWREKIHFPRQITMLKEPSSSIHPPICTTLEEMKQCRGLIDQYSEETTKSDRNQDCLWHESKSNNVGFRRKRNWSFTKVLSLKCPSLTYFRQKTATDLLIDTDHQIDHCIRSLRSLPPPLLPPFELLHTATEMRIRHVLLTLHPSSIPFPIPFILAFVMWAANDPKNRVGDTDIMNRGYWRSIWANEKRTILRIQKDISEVAKLEKGRVKLGRMLWKEALSEDQRLELFSQWA